MEVENNVSKIKPSKQSMITVNIEGADESWALKLLDEQRGIDDEHIKVQPQEYLKQDDKNNPPKTINKQFEMSHSDQIFVASKNEDINGFDAEILSLSAIENQKLELAEKKASLSAAQSLSKLNSELLLFRIKALLRFDLLTLFK